MMIPIFLRASILALAFLSFTLLKDKFTILNGDSLSRFSINAARVFSLNKLYDKFKFDVLFRYSTIFKNPTSDI